MSEENEEIEVFVCPKCEEPQEYLVWKGGGWSRCPNCDKAIFKNDIPENLRETIIRKEPKSPKKKPKPESEPEPGDDEEEEESPFNRAKPEWKILESVLRQFNVPEKARTLIISRCRRRTLDPNELQRMLQDLKTGLQKNEVQYVAEEYYYAVEGQREEFGGDKTAFSRSFRPSEDNERSGDYGGFRPQRKSDYGEVPAWERDKKSKEDNRGMTRDEFERMWQERVEKKENQEQIKTLQGTIQDMGNAILELKREVVDGSSKNKENTNLEFYKMIMDTKESGFKEQFTLLSKIQDERDNHSKDMFEMYKSQAEQKPILNTQGYKDDSMRLLADAINASTTTFAANKPLQQFAKISAASQKADETPPIEDNPIKRKEKTGILSDIPDDMIEEE